MPGYVEIINTHISQNIYSHNLRIFDIMPTHEIMNGYLALFDKIRARREWQKSAKYAEIWETSRSYSFAADERRSKPGIIDGRIFL